MSVLGSEDKNFLKQANTLLNITLFQFFSTINKRILLKNGIALLMLVNL